MSGSDGKLILGRRHLILYIIIFALDIVSLPALECIEMAKKKEKPIGAKLENRLAEEAGYNDDSTAKPITRKKKNIRKRRHGESTESRHSSDNLAC